MINLTFEEMSYVLCGGKVVSVNSDLLMSGYSIGSCDRVEYVSAVIDSRVVEEGTIFFALKGTSFNGNKFVHNAFNSGASVCVVDEVYINSSDIPVNCALIVVPDVEKALGFLASYYVTKLGTTVVGVTGSVGKTSTKDIIASALGESLSVLKTKGNFNNHIGLPLTIFNLEPHHDVAVLEMGMNHFGEIEYLSSLAKPDICLITNIGTSHIENLGSQHGIMRAKMEIVNSMKKDGVLIVNGEDILLNSLSQKTYEIQKIGFSAGCNYYATNIENLINSMGSKFVLHNGSISLNCVLDAPGKHNILNCLLAYAVAKKLNVPDEDFIKGISSIEKSGMRLEFSDISGVKYINDCYNASPESMKSSMDVQLALKSNRSIAVLGTMYELGDKSDEAHVLVAEYAKSAGVDMVFTTGECSALYKSVLGDRCFIYDDKLSLVHGLIDYTKEGDSVLIKASRGAKFEKILNTVKGLIEEQQRGF